MARCTPGIRASVRADERVAARVLEPLNPVIRLDDPIVERVAVREQDVEIAVLVEVDELDAGRAPVRVRRGVDDLRIEREAAGARVDVREHGLVLLREQRDEVHLPSWLRSAGTMWMAPERGSMVWLTKSGCDGFVVRFSTIVTVPASASRTRRPPDRLAVAVEVGGLDVGDARPVVEPQRVELALARPRSQITEPLL